MPPHLRFSLNRMPSHPPLSTTFPSFYPYLCIILKQVKASLHTLFLLEPFSCNTQICQQVAVTPHVLLFRFSGNKSLPVRHCAGSDACEDLSVAYRDPGNYHPLIFAEKEAEILRGSITRPKITPRSLEAGLEWWLPSIPQCWLCALVSGAQFPEENSEPAAFFLTVQAARLPSSPGPILSGSHPGTR